MMVQSSRAQKTHSCHQVSVILALEDFMIERIRNVATLRIDHGKTTLVDKLLAASGTLDRKELKMNA